MKPTFSFLCALIVAAPIVLPGCGTGGTQCTAIAASSVTVTVVNDVGAVQPDAKVTFSVDGGQEQAAECVQPAGTGCQSWTAGVEQTGMFTLKAVSGDGLKHAQASATVTSDECHVIGQAVKLTLM
jgi:hypothetical protein